MYLPPAQIQLRIVRHGQLRASVRDAIMCDDGKSYSVFNWNFAIIMYITVALSTSVVACKYTTRADNLMK